VGTGMPRSSDISAGKSTYFEYIFSVKYLDKQYAVLFAGMQNTNIGRKI